MNRQRGLARKKVLRGCLLVFVLVLVGAGVFYGPVIRDLMSNGFLQSLLSGENMRKYSGTSMENLKALSTAMKLYQESEGQFPESAGWMDALEDRVKSHNMTQEEADKKFHDPTLGKKPDVYGYAMNDLLSKMYIGDVKDPSKTPLLFDSKDTSRNAHGSPEKLLPKPARPGGNIGVAADGHALKL